jgi:hypothetical protein
MFTVVLEIRLNGAAVGTTSDVIEAATEEEAERKAIQAWRAARPDRSFAPLLTAVRE